MKTRLRALAGWTIPLALAIGIALAVHSLVRGRDTLSFSLFGRAAILASPRALYALSCVPLLYAALRVSLVDLSRAQQWLSATLRALLFITLALALARPQVVDSRHTVATVLLVDVSDSISDRQLDRARAFVEHARALRHGDDVLRLVTFARHPRLVDLPPEGTALPDAKSWRHGKEGDATDFEGALELAYSLFPPDTLRRAVLISDGGETLGNLAAEAFAARQKGVHLDWTSFPAAQDDEVLVRAVELPAGVKVGAPFQVTARIYASRATAATVTLYRDQFVNPFDGQKQLALTAGENVVSWKSEVTEPGFTTFKVALSGLAHDHFAANNQAVASLTVKGKPRVLYIEGEPESAGYLANALRHENIDVDVRSSYGLPTSPRELAHYDLVLLSDVPAMFAGPAQMSALESYVRDLGGTFVMAGGPNSFGSGGYQGSKIESLLPVRFDQEKKRDQPALAVELCIDRSGSMMANQKLELAKDAAKQAAEVLEPDDLIGVIAFDSLAMPIVRLQRAANRARIASDIARLQAGGGTAILPCLQKAYQELDPTPAKVKHVILLTDGQAQYDGISELVDEMVEHKITVSAVGVGPEADKTLLTMIAERGGGRFYHTMDAQNVPKIFTKEISQVARSALVESPVHVHATRRSEILSGVDIASAPPLRGYVVTRPKPLAEVILESDLGEPILARWRLGLGQTVAFTSDVKNRWAADWLRWPGYPKFWAHLVRATMRHTPGESGASALGASFELSTEVDPPHARVSVDAIGADDRFLTGLDSTLEVIDPDHPQKPLTIPLREVAAGRYQGDFTLDRYGSYLLRAVHKQNGVEVAESAGTLSLPYPREYLALPPDLALLERAAATTQGRRLDGETAAGLFDARGESVPFERDLWPRLLWLAALLLLLDVTARRVRLFPDHTAR